MFKDEFIEIFNNVWPMLAVYIVSVVSIRIVYVMKSKTKINIFNELFWLFFMVYLTCLFYVVTLQDISWANSNFVLFKEIFRYEFGTKLFFKNVIGNMIMFIPYGYFVSSIMKDKKPLGIIFLTLIASVSIEVVQLIIGRVFDVDDILLNVIGGTIGFVLYCVIDNLSRKIYKIIKRK